jgi:hypothetical protein
VLFVRRVARCESSPDPVFPSTTLHPMEHFGFHTRQD